MVLHDSIDKLELLDYGGPMGVNYCYCLEIAIQQSFGLSVITIGYENQVYSIFLQQFHIILIHVISMRMRIIRLICIV